MGHINENEHLSITINSSIAGVLEKLQSKIMLILNLLDFSIFIYMNIIIAIIIIINIFRNKYIVEDTFRVLL
jgi:hypothetical protein